MKMYRLRSLDKLLSNEYEELEKQTIHFAPFSELNDPMEGIADIIWQGDSIVWKNLFRHYLLCLEQQVSLATLHKPEESERFFEYSFPIFLSENGLPTDLYRQHFNVIKERFFSNISIIAIIDYLGNRNTPIRKEQLAFVFSMIASIALESILFGHDKAGFQPQTEFWGYLQKLTSQNHMEDMFNAMSNPEMKDETFDILMAISSQAIQQLNLLSYCKLGEQAKLINWGYFMMDFPQKYLSEIPRLVYPNWYSASFMSEFPENTVLWGHYADNHKGVCLIFEAEQDNNHADPYISIERPTSYNSNGANTGYSPISFKKVNYENTREQVDFFKRLWTQSRYIVTNEWYTDTEGQRSSFIAETNPTEEIRLAYWNKLSKIQTTKTTVWKYENEYRLLLDDSFHKFTEPQSRTLSYNFNSLEGIVFGIRTPINEKVKIIETVINKCQEVGRTDFKFFQSRFDDLQCKIVLDQLDLLQLK